MGDGGGLSCSWVKSCVCLTIRQCHPPLPLPSWLQRSVFVHGVGAGAFCCRSTGLSALSVRGCWTAENISNQYEAAERGRKKTGGKCQVYCLSKCWWCCGLVLMSYNYTHQFGRPSVEFWGLFLYLRMTGSHRQPPMRDFVHLPIHLGGIKPSTQRDRLSVALMSNVQSLVTAMLVENHQIVPCWHAGLSWGMCQLSSKKCMTADLKWFIFLFETELRSTGTAHHFAYLLNTSDYRILRMDEDYDRMYIGSKDHILSLDLHDINKDPHIVSSFSSHSRFWPLE